jgi:MoxR-like ATPase
MSLSNVKSEVNAALIEREREVDLMLIGLVSRQNVLFVGVPGTGKSMLAEAIIKAVGLLGFCQLMHKFLPPEEILGPVKLSGLKRDVYERMVGGMLPEAEVAFLDEIWKSSPALLNTLLRLLNEREFMNGTVGMIKCPLEFAIAASNEWPIGDGYETLGALFDRFLIRATINPVSKGRRRDLLFGVLPEVKTVSSMAEVKKSQKWARDIKWTADAEDGLEDVLDALAGEGIIVGDRRSRAAVSVVSATAALSGKANVEREHLEVLQHVLWAVPDQERKTAEIVCKLANPTGARINEILTAADDVIDAIKDVESPDAFAAAKKVKAMLDELAVMGTKGNGRATKAKQYISGRMVDLKKKMLGVAG